MVTGRGMHTVDGGLERMRRRNVDVVHAAGVDAGRPRVAAGATQCNDTATQRNDLRLHRRKLRHGHDDHDGRRGRLSRL